MSEQRTDLPRVVVDAETRERVQRAAERSGLSIGSVLWLLIHRSLDDVERGLDGLAPRNMSARHGRDYRTLA